VWETWLSLLVTVPSEVYKPNGIEPDKWEQLKRGTRQLVLDRSLERESVLRVRRDSRSTFSLTLRFPRSSARIARTLSSLLAKGCLAGTAWRPCAIKLLSRTIGSSSNFPPGKGNKAGVASHQDADKPRYFWREAIGLDGKDRAYGLVSLHIITKDLPNWFWADFGARGLRSQEGSLRPSWTTSSTRGSNDRSC